MSCDDLEVSKCPLCGGDLWEDEDGVLNCDCGWEDEEDMDYDKIEKDYPDPTDEEIKDALANPHKLIFRGTT